MLFQKTSQRFFASSTMKQFHRKYPSLLTGVMGQPMFPKGNVAFNSRREFTNIAGWLAAFSTMMIVWPWVAIHGSNFWHSVPGQTPQVYLEHGKAVVNIPSTQVHLDKPSDEE